MDLAWITLYDYMSIHSQIQLKQKTNKFYESFYPLKLKRQAKKNSQFKQIDRGGLLGMIATYISRVLSMLSLYLNAEYLLSSNDTKEQIKLACLFVQIQRENIAASLQLEKKVFVIHEMYQVFTGKQGTKNMSKGFLELKLLSSLKRLFEFYYELEDFKKILDRVGFQKMYSIIRINSIECFKKAKPHFKLFPEIASIMNQILVFFSQDEKPPFNFHFYLVENNQNETKQQFKRNVKQLFSILPNKQKQIFLNLSDQNFYQFLVNSGVSFPKQTIENYMRLEEEVNSLIAQEKNFIESIAVAENYRGKSQWKKIVVSHLIKISTENKRVENNRFLQSRKFKQSQDFPLDNL